TVDEFLATCEKLKQAGVTPVATAYQGWILRLMFNSIAMGKMGAGAYRDYFTTGRADLVPALRDAILVFKTVLESYVNDDASEDGFNWTNAAQAVYSGDAAMFMHGDWAKGYLMQLGWRPGVDFGVVGAPGAADLFLYGVDVFAIPRGAQNERGAREFLETIASKDAQVAFNRIKGSSPIRMDAPTEQLDPLARATLADLRAARVRMLVRSRPAWDDAIGRFARTRDVDALVRAFVDEPPG
ncbi:MAG TPA: extracellular solute-binding protein, partial [Polyangiaceae bacterium]|nr:extracellular solute-binding protein [Polyangiaceae bacterium]